MNDPAILRTHTDSGSEPAEVADSSERPSLPKLDGLERCEALQRLFRKWPENSELPTTTMKN
jgi:hypothetical protein